MRLHYRKIGAGKPLVVLHGVFGSSDNLYTVCKNISEQGFEVYILDARNHGQSPRADEFNYTVLAEDLNTFLDDHKLNKPVILGHSMGGKTVLEFSQTYDNFSKLIVVDIAAKGYSPHHDHIIKGLQAIDLNTLTSRKEAEQIFSQYVTDLGEQQFLLKNLYRSDNGGFDWRINIPVLAASTEKVVSAISLHKKIEKPLLLMRGSDSKYVSDQSVKDLESFYTDLTLVTIEGANHWIHATKPKEFVEGVVSFIAKA